MRRERAKLLNFYLNVSTFWTFKDDSRLFEVGRPLSPWMERPSAMMPVEGKYDAFMACRYAYDKKQAHGASVVMATALLSEDIRFKGGEILTRNFNTYELPRFSALPDIEVILVKNDELSPQGGGEPAIVPMGAVVANAIFDATGARLHQMPMTPERVKQAIASA